MNAYLRPLVPALLACAVGCIDFAREEQEFCERNPAQCEGPCVATNPDDQPDDEFRDTNCDGVDGIATSGLYVDPVNGADSNAGTRERPVKTIKRALELLRGDAGAGITALYLSQGIYSEDQLTLDRPVSLYGAFGGTTDNWKRKSEYTSRVNGGTVGLVIRGIPGDAGVVIDRLTVTSANATDAGMPSIALQVIDSQGIRLRHSTFVAGQGGPGTNGTPGDAGTDGGVGQAGATAEGNTAPSTVAFGGVSNCGGMNQSGGAGRSGATSGAPGVSGTAGRPNGGPGGPGGDAGIPTVYDMETGNKRCLAQAGGMGAAGFEGGAGPSGERGEGMGALSGDMWVATQHGGNGTAGTPGTGGGGGGSGGSCPYVDPVNGAAGGGSGGGGGGGCGGGGGTGGGGGGASIAVLLIRSNVQWEGTTTLRTGGGGRGGNGGEGGMGGRGGHGGGGGDGGIIESNIRYLSHGGGGGAGGAGGNGGRGGHGGGGGGGPSVGVWCADASYANTGSFNTEGILNGGPGGGTGPGGNTGAAGQKVLVQGCP